MHRYRYDFPQIIVGITVQVWVKFPRWLFPNMLPKLAESSAGLVPQEHVGELQVTLI